MSSKNDLSSFLTATPEVFYDEELCVHKNRNNELYLHQLQDQDALSELKEKRYHVYSVHEIQNSESLQAGMIDQHSYEG